MSNQTRKLLEAAAAVAALALAGCGGGGGSPSGGISSTPLSAAEQLASGVITGFGSVYVDRVRLDDSAAAAVTEQADGTLRPTMLQLGQRLHVTHDGKGKASRLVVDAAVIGKVTAVNVADGTLQSAGQTVRVNTDAALGAVTQYGGYDSTAAGRYTALSDVRVDDLAEVHGTPILEGGQWTIRATRIDKRNAIGAVRVTGVVSGLVNTVDTKTFALGALTVDFAAALNAGRVRPADRLADGAPVRVFGDAAGVVNGRLVADGVRIGGDREGLATSTRLQIGGLVSARDVAGGTFKLDGSVIRVGSAALEPAGATIADGAWVKVDGVLASDGSVEALRITVRQNDVTNDLARVELEGPVTGFQDNDNFIVRNVPVDASEVAAADRTGCSQIAEGTRVSIKAVMQAGTDVVLAGALKCEPHPDGHPVEWHVGGRVVSIDQAARTITVADREGQHRVIRWNDRTAFSGRDLTGAAMLQVDRPIQAEGVLDGTTLVAKEISQDGARPVDRFRERPPQAQGQPADHTEARESWSAYRAMPRPPQRR